MKESNIKNRVFISEILDDFKNNYISDIEATDRILTLFIKQNHMKTYNITVEQVSKSMHRQFNVLVDGKHIGLTSCNKPSFGSDYGKDNFVEIIFENAYQLARRVIICHFENDVDVFTKGIATMSFGDYKIKWAAQ